VNALKCPDTCSYAKFIHVSPPDVSPELATLILNPEARVARLARLRKETEEFASRVLAEVEKNATVRRFTNHTQRLEVIRCSERHRNWVRSPEGQKSQNSRNLSATLTEVKKCMEPVYDRIAENLTFWNIANKLHEEISEAQRLVNTSKETAAPEDMERVFKLEATVTNLSNWFNQSLHQNMVAPHEQFMPINPQVFVAKYREFHREFVAFKKKVGGAGLTMKRGDGTPVTRAELEALGGLQFLANMQHLGEDKAPPEETDMEDDL
jgi:hypothetical protein